MASRHVSAAPEGVEGLANRSCPDTYAWENAPTVSIPKWLMVLAARGEVTLRCLVDLEDDPLSDSDDNAQVD